MKNFRTLGTFGPISFVATSMKPPQQVTKYIIGKKVMVCLQVWVMMNLVKFCCLLFICALIWIHLAQMALLFGFVQVDHSLNSYLWISLIPWISSICIPNLPHLFFLWELRIMPEVYIPLQTWKLVGLFTFDTIYKHRNVLI